MIQIRAVKHSLGVAELKRHFLWIGFSLLLSNTAQAQGTNGRALPFEAGYFPGLNTPRVVKTNSGVEITADDRQLSIQYPLDRIIVRTILVKNISSEKVLVQHRATVGISGFDAANLSTHPQSPYLYLDPGQSQPYRVTYEIPLQAPVGPPGWLLGMRIDAPVTIFLQVRPPAVGGLPDGVHRLSPERR